MNKLILSKLSDFQDRSNESYWRPMEKTFGQSAYNDRFDDFIRDYLTIKTLDIPKKGKVYETFKNYARGKEKASLVKDLHVFAGYYCAIALGQETNTLLKTAFSDLNELKVNVSYPFLIRLYWDYMKNLLTVEDFEGIIRLIENYVFRRAVCYIPTNSLNKTFAEFARRDWPTDNYLESVKAHLELLTYHQRFPKHDEFLREIQNRDLYHFRNRSYFLRKLENHGRKEPVNINEYTIEHILPQNENLSQKWRAELGPDWKEIQEKIFTHFREFNFDGL